MNLLLARDVFGETYTLGVLTVDGLPFGFTVEDEDRGLDAGMPIEEIRRRKVKAETAIPAGVYPVKRTWSPKYERLVPIVQNVPGFAGIRIHSGNDEADTEGCILPGLSRDAAKGTIGKSRAAVAWLDKEIAACEARGEAVTLTIRRAP